MLVMPSNHSSGTLHYWAGKYGAVGHLYSPGFQRGPYPWLPYALDNGAFVAFTKRKPWDEAAYRRLVVWAAFAPRPPSWVLVPDVVADRDGTLARWRLWRDFCGELGVPLAFAVQDGMTAGDVPSGADVIFVGGSTAWKWASLSGWCAAFPRVHVGRVNTYARLAQCAALGVESCDGSGWFRGSTLNHTSPQLAGLKRFLEEQHARRHPALSVVARPSSPTAIRAAVP